MRTPGEREWAYTPPGVRISLSPPTHPHPRAGVLPKLNGERTRLACGFPRPRGKHQHRSYQSTAAASQRYGDKRSTVPNDGRNGRVVRLHLFQLSKLDGGALARQSPRSLTPPNHAKGSRSETNEGLAVKSARDTRASPLSVVMAVMKA